MRLTILGATGGIGRLLLPLALDQGHEVTAFARAPEKITRNGSRLRVLGGDLFNAQQMTAAIQGSDAVLSAFGPTTLAPTHQRRNFGHILVSRSAQLPSPASSTSRRPFSFAMAAFSSTSSPTRSSATSPSIAATAKPRWPSPTSPGPSSARRGCLTTHRQAESASSPATSPKEAVPSPAPTSPPSCSRRPSLPASSARS